MTSAFDVFHIIDFFSFGQ